MMAALAEPGRIVDRLTAVHSPSQLPTPYLRGRGVGGSSNVNAMIALRGMPQDYDHWAADLGCTGWSWSDLRPWFLDVEDDADRGRSGGSRPGPAPGRERGWTRDPPGDRQGAGGPAGGGRTVGAPHGPRHPGTVAVTTVLEVSTSVVLSVTPREPVDPDRFTGEIPDDVAAALTTSGQPLQPGLWRPRSGPVRLLFHLRGADRLAVGHELLRAVRSMGYEADLSFSP